MNLEELGDLYEQNESYFFGTILTIPPNPRCTCGRVLHYEAHERNLRDEKMTAKQSFESLGYGRPCCRNKLTTAKETRIRQRPLPKYMTSFPASKEPRSFLAR